MRSPQRKSTVLDTTFGLGCSLWVAGYVGRSAAQNSIAAHHTHAHARAPGIPRLATRRKKLLVAVVVAVVVVVVVAELEELACDQAQRTIAQLQVVLGDPEFAHLPVALSAQGCRLERIVA